MKKKNLLALGLSLVMSVSLLTACSGGNGGTSPAPETKTPETAPVDNTQPVEPAALNTVEAG